VGANRDERSELTASCLEQDGRGARLIALLRLAILHPLRMAEDLRARRRWRGEEEVRPLRSLAARAGRLRAANVEHLHVHFAAGAALDTMRLAHILGLPYSVTAHAYEIFAAPANLPEKLSRAAFVTTGCEYNVRHLRELLPPESRARVHRMVMGVDADEFARTAGPRGGRRVIAVGRLVEKKGFGTLIEAAAILRESRPLERLTIVGDGPLREALEERARALGIADTTEFAGSLSSSAIRDRLQSSDLLAMPCVVAADGDRDSMPVVVKEAMAMELPIVASREVGLTELVKPEFGRLTPPRDARALAESIAEVLDLPAREREEMGRAARASAIEQCDLKRETSLLVSLVRSGPTPVPSGG
jgi:glycosyltransferase involved in cell wall biosynthesis